MHIRTQIFRRFPLLYTVAQYYGHVDFIVKMFRQINQASRQWVTKHLDLLAKLLKARTFSIVDFTSIIKRDLENGMKYKLIVLNANFDRSLTPRKIKEFWAFCESKPELRFKTLSFDKIYTVNIESINKLILTLLNTHQINQDKHLLFEILSINQYFQNANHDDPKPEVGAALCFMIHYQSECEWVLT